MKISVKPIGKMPSWKQLVSLKNMSLAKKFGAISAMLIVGFMAMGAAYYTVTVVNSNATDRTADITNFGQEVSDINIQFLDMRRLEKDFMLNKNAEQLGEHEVKLNEVDLLISALAENPPTEAIGDLVSDMTLYLSLYKGSFNEMAASMQIAGLDSNSGLIGKLNSSASNINELVNDEGAIVLQNSLMKLREIERDFMASPSDELKDSLLAERDMFLILLDEAGMDEDVSFFIKGDLEVYVDSLVAYGESLLKLNAERDTFSEVALEFTPLFTQLRSAKDDLLTATMEKASGEQVQISVVFVTVMILIAVVVNIAFYAVSKIISAPLRQAVQLSAAIANGKLDNRVEINSTDETGELLSGLENMQTQLVEQQTQLKAQMDQTRLQAEEASRMAEEQTRMAAEQAQIATENGRIKQALDGVSSPVLMMNAELEIIYMNNSCTTMFRQGESDIRKALPGFSANNIIGKTADCLYTDGSRETMALRNLSNPQTSDKELGGRSYRITVSPVLDSDNKRIGTVAEWIERTTEVAVEKEVHSIVGSAMKGDLAQRIELNNKVGFFLELSTGVNKLMEVVEQVITDTVESLSCLAQGDLTHTMDGNFEGIFANLKSDVNTTVSKLTEVVRNIQNSSMSLESVATEISDSNGEVSMRTEQQAASLEETAAAIEEMTATVRQTAGNTDEANSLAGEASLQAVAGGEIVGQAIAAMADINNSSKQISNIIGVIDEISFQTNLLALNAAVEAARAGEQGRGFAVVADEVRKLAAHSASAAKEIKELIDDSNRQVERGSGLVNKSGEALNSIVSSIKRVTTIISEISTASQEQADGIEQVNSSISNMDEGTQQNAAMVEKVTMSINTMSDEVQNLGEMIKFFSIESHKKSGDFRRLAG